MATEIGGLWRLRAAVAAVFGGILLGGSMATGQVGRVSEAGPAVVAAEELFPNKTEVLVEDSRVRLEFGREFVIQPRGLQPSLLVTSAGTIVMQGQLPAKPLKSARISYPNALETIVSRDGGKTWTRMAVQEGSNGINLEAGAIQLKDGTILALDTYVTPGAEKGTGVGQLYVSKDDWKTLEGPIDVPFKLPGINFHASKDDGGRPHDAARLHRRIIQLPNGDLLTTIYANLEGDDVPCTYEPRMKKSRILLVRSSDLGRSWEMIGNITAEGVGTDVGTEGLVEPVIHRVSKGPKAGRILCFIRTGRNLFESMSDDDGKTWTPAKEIVIAGIDVNKHELWVDHFRKFKGKNGKPLDENNVEELRGAVVDPELLELRSGALLLGFGVRIPQKFCWTQPEHPWNGNYLAVSLDHGETWSHVVRFTSGVNTTHYMALAETPKDNELYLTYDLGSWGKQPRRDLIGRTLKVSVSGTLGGGQ